MEYYTTDGFKYDLLEKDANKILVKKLVKFNLKISTSESFTGGLISKLITDVPGASRVFEYGVCTYSNDAKIKILGIDKNVLKKYGPVSLETSNMMAVGVLKLSGADLAISSTGYAGSEKEKKYNKNVGLIFIGVFFKNKIYTVKLDFKSRNEVKHFSRNYVRKQSSKHALSLAIKLID